MQSADFAKFPGDTITKGYDELHFGVLLFRLVADACSALPTKIEPTVED
ncbi:hypothetical protein AK812_SmicGene45365, partial [Symbiodinium microadriaticum]